MTKQRRDTIDDILDIIDAGPQTAMPDPTFSEVSPRNAHTCAHCFKAEPAEESDWCDPCRAFLLGDSKVDPARPPDLEEAYAAYASVWEACRGVSYGLVQWYNTVSLAIQDLGAAIPEPSPPPTPERVLRCFGGPIDGETRIVLSGELIINVMNRVPASWLSEHASFVITTTQYRVEEVHYRIYVSAYPWGRWFWDESTYVLLAEGYPIQNIIDQMSVVAALPDVLNRWGQP